MKIVRLYAENFKNLRVIDVNLKDGINVFSGGNGAGKTSALDAIFYILRDQKSTPPKLIRKGANKGKLQAQMDDGTIILRDLDQKGGTLEIQTPNKTLIRDPLAELAKIQGKLGFDPFEFMRLEASEKFDVLRGLVEMEVDVDDLETRNENDAERISDLRAERKRLQAQLDGLPKPDADLPEKAYDIGAMMTNLNKADETNRAIEADKRKRESHELTKQRMESAVNQRQERIDELMEEVASLGEAIKKDRDELNAMLEIEKEWKPLDKPVDTITLRDQIGEKAKINTAITANASLASRREELEKQIDEADESKNKLDEAIRDRKVRIGKAMTDAKFPIPGLSFETEEQGSGGRERKNPKRVVTYNGIPIEDASTAEQIRVSVAIGIATNPKVRTLLIREGSLIDDKGRELLKQMAREFDFQFILEEVDTTGKVGFYLEDGAIKAVNSEDEPEAAPAPKAKAKRGAK